MSDETILYASFTGWQGVQLDPNKDVLEQVQQLHDKSLSASSAPEHYDGDEELEEIALKRTTVPFALKVNGKWNLETSSLLMPASEFSDLKKIQYPEQYVSLMVKESYTFSIHNKLSDSLTKTNVRTGNGHWENSGPKYIQPGETKSLKCRADWLGGLSGYVTYQATVAGKKVDVTWRVQATLAFAAECFCTISDETLLKKAKTSNKWTLEYTCNPGYHWDSDVDACVKNPPNVAALVAPAPLVLASYSDFSDFATSTTGTVVLKLIQFGAGKIPFAGTLFSSLVAVYWPSKEKEIDPEELWQGLQQYAENLFDKKIEEYEMKQILLGLQTVQQQLTDMEISDKSRKGTIFIDCFNELERLKDRATDKFETYLAAAIPILTLYLTALIMYRDKDGEIFENPLNSDEIERIEGKIRDTIGYKDRLRKHIDAIKKERGNTEYDRHLVDIEMDVYWDVARVWPAVLKQTVEERKNYFYPIGVKTPARSIDDPATTHIYEMVIRCGAWMDGIRIRHDNGQTSGFQGQKSGVPFVYYFEKGEYIHSIEGRASNHIYQLVLKTTKGNSLAPHFLDQVGGDAFPIAIKPRLGRDVLLAVHIGLPKNEAHVEQLFFEFGSIPKE